MLKLHRLLSILVVTDGLLFTMQVAEEARIFLFITSAYDNVLVNVENGESHT